MDSLENTLEKLTTGFSGLCMCLCMSFIPVLKMSDSFTRKNNVVRRKKGQAEYVVISKEVSLMLLHFFDWYTAGRGIMLAFMQPSGRSS